LASSQSRDIPGLPHRTKKYVYEIWGDTVNTASRMESTGVPGEIQVSESTHRLLAEHYAFEDRGLIAVKGKGDVRAYLLKGPSA
jgi:class 3 adenylate cyclase